MKSMDGGLPQSLLEELTLGYIGNTRIDTPSVRTGQTTILGDCSSKEVQPI